MTLVLSFLTQDFILQVSDRRLTWPDGSVEDDNTNKATIYCGRMALGYTGLAQIKTRKTDEWLAGILARAQSSPEALEIIKNEATAHFRGISQTPRQRRHAFVGVGWTRTAADGAIRPFFSRVSNFHDAQDQELPAASDEFTVRNVLLDASDPPRLDATGRQLTEDERLLLGAGLRYMKDPTEIALALARTIRVVAGRDNAVGRGVLAVHIPRAAVENPDQRFMVVSGGTAPEAFVTFAPGSFYLAAGTQTALQHMPNVVCYGVAMVRAEAGPASP